MLAAHAHHAAQSQQALAEPRHEAEPRAARASRPVLLLLPASVAACRLDGLLRDGGGLRRLVLIRASSRERLDLLSGGGVGACARRGLAFLAQALVALVLPALLAAEPAALLLLRLRGLGLLALGVGDAGGADGGRARRRVHLLAALAAEQPQRLVGARARARARGARGVDADQALQRAAAAALRARQAAREARLRRVLLELQPSEGAARVQTERRRCGGRGRWRYVV